MSENIKISKDAIYATGKRKESVARVWILKGDGKITINGKKYNEYFKRPVHQLVIEKPFDITKTKNNYDIFATVSGGGMSGQAGAITHGISKALVGIDPTFRKSIKKNKLLTRDSRTVERKKYGQRKARRRFQFSKR
ncbi:MAG: 30S ribosomal protein S9 [Candidatus Pelagibacter sp.]|nr:30S ribosomal protein S9 [Candidatus Pelagibacter sp.]OUW11628.1 MAG: 30S ribosomal protein S9 [Candidatus Pelagibacter sp. TMED166]|tara:strand:- start:55641 stop:56051 length:411 start_codon:yes stop_codon:yes gene_type:complete